MSYWFFRTRQSIHTGSMQLSQELTKKGLKHAWHFFLTGVTSGPSKKNIYPLKKKPSYNSDEDEFDKITRIDLMSIFQHTAFEQHTRDQWVLASDSDVPRSEKIQFDELCTRTNSKGSKSELENSASAMAESNILPFKIRNSEGRWQMILDQQVHLHT